MPNWARRALSGACDGAIRPVLAFAARNPCEGAAGAEFRCGYFFFLGADVRAVLHDIFLDGNTFQDSHSVEKKPFVADLSAGPGFALPGLKVTCAVVCRAKQFGLPPQDEQVFGSLLVSCFY